MTQFASILVPSAYAASSPWSQTNWAGESGTNVTTSVANQVTLTATSNWCSNTYCTSSWADRRKITFNNTDVNLGVTSENLVNFPVLVKLSSSNIDYTKTQDSGQDIRFTDTDGTDLAYEIEKWDETGTSFVWVKVPQIDINSSTDYIYMYYGNASATDHQQATSVWDSNYQMVQHLRETDIDGGAGDIKDSTANANNGTTSGMDSADQVVGQIDGSFDFDGSDDLIDTTTNVLFTTAFTIEAWFNAPVWLTGTGGVTMESILAKWNCVNSQCGAGRVDEGYQLGRFYGGTNFGIAINNGADGTSSRAAAVATSTISTGVWHHAVATFVGGSYLRLFIDGVLVNENTTSMYASVADAPEYKHRIGMFSHNYGKFQGFIDDVRISNSARSAAWIAASYKSESDGYSTFGAEEPEYQTSGTLTSSIFDTELTSATAWGTLTFAATTPTSTTATVKVRTSNDSGMSGATAFGSCTAISSGSDISSNGCVTDGHRYVQYLLTLSTSAPASTPTFTSFSLAFSSSDSSAPSISLTALSPDPNTDTTPTLSGTATESVSTVTNVQFQMDSTSGSWTACTASDGSFNSASEAFSCTAATLTDGSHIMYVQTTDSNGNTTSSGYASDTFTIDATTPVSIDLDSPGDNSYTNNERPTYRWKATTDATAGLSKYVLEIDNSSIGSSQPSGDFTIDNIPTSGTADITSNNKYVIHFDGFSDSDNTNNYISVYTKSSSDWGTSENDGKLREGRVSWKVKAVDNAGNETSSSRTLFVDRTNPNVEFTQINSTPYISNNFSTTDKTPTIFGKITDTLAGGDSSQTQDENGPKVASGPKSVEIKVEKKEGLLYGLITLYTINMDKPWYTCDNQEVSDNTKQRCDKYLPFEYTQKDNLELGTYRITLTGKDKADNSSGATTLTLNVTTLAQITTQFQNTSEGSEFGKGFSGLGKPDAEGNITVPTEVPEPNALEKAGENITQAGKNIIQGIGNLITTVFTGIGNGIAFIFNKTGECLAFIFSKAGEALAFIGNGIGTGISNIAQGIGGTYNNIAQHTSGVTKNILLAIGNGFSATGNFIGTIASNIGTGIHNTGQAIAQGFNSGVSSTKGGIANLAFGVGEKTQDVSDTLGFAFVKFGYLFVNEPTKIYDVNVLVLSPTSVKVSWITNHPANGKVNYGLDRTYPFDQQTEKRTTHHEFTLNNLQPDTAYLFEVMSQNKNYVYDANREFKTPAK